MDKESSGLPTPDKKSGPGATPGKPEKDPKDKPELAGIPKNPGDDPNEPKNSPPPHKQPNTPNTIHNRDQDPNHPANNTLSPRLDPAPRPVAEGITVPPAELLTEQEKLAADSGGTDPNAGVGPVTPAAYTSGPVQTIEDLGIGPRTPYPTGNPPPPREETTLSQGIWRGDEPNAPTNVPNRRDIPGQRTAGDSVPPRAPYPAAERETTTTTARRGNRAVSRRKTSTSAPTP